MILQEGLNSHEFSYKTLITQSYSFERLFST